MKKDKKIKEDKKDKNKKKAKKVKVQTTKWDIYKRVIAAILLLALSAGTLIGLYEMIRYIIK